jgi:hypothetical protein
MRGLHKLREVVPGDAQESASGRLREGHAIGLRPDGQAVFRASSGDTFDVRIPRHVDKRWLAAALALAPVPGIADRLDVGMAPVLAYVFAAPEHEALDEHVHIDGKTIALSARESVEIATGKSIVKVTAAGEIQVRGRNVTSRASNLNRIRGGAVKIN